ncbi:MAG: DUF6600 domain-containing protein [Acidobacteriota bacterium]
MRPTAMRILALAALLPLAGWAQDEDGPGRGVARISLINGDVSVRRGDSGDWVAAAVNAPLVVHDRVLTGPSSRAEVQFDWANMVRLAPGTEVRLAELEHQRYQVQVARGTVMLRVLRDSNAQIEVNTPSVSLRPESKGIYRITVSEDGQSEVTVRSGEAEVYTPSGVERLRSGRTMLVRGSSSNPEFQVVSAIARDDWDQWNENRDRYLERSRSYEYVSRDVYGADDLDHYGRWVNVPSYGWAWSPSNVGPSWAPYRHGRWTWIDWYGWSWQSYDPWGWAPFHYGRWFNYGNYGWCWWPGYRHNRHYWRPALVGWFGLGIGGVHLGVGFGRVGWVPLAPYETFHPWYGRRYYGGYRNYNHVDNSVRIVNNVNITNVYRNARVSNAVSGMDSTELVRGGRIQSLRVSDAEVQRASLMQGRIPVAPRAESVRFSDREVSAGSLPRGENTRFFSRRAAADVERVPFEDQRRGMEHIVRRTFEPGAAGEAAGSVRAGGEGAGRGAAARADSGNLPRGAGEAAGRRTEAAAEPAQLPRGERAADERGGWRRVGEPVRSEAAAGQGAAEGRRVGESVRSGPSAGQGAAEGRRMGSGRSEAGSVPRSSDERGWRRFGEPVNRSGSEPQAMPRGVEPRGSRAERSSEAPRERRSPEPRAEPRPAEPVRERERSPEPARVERQERRERRSPETPDPGWRSFGSGSVRSGSEGRFDPGQGSIRSQSESGWRRFSESPRVEPRAPERIERGASPNWSSPRYERGGGIEPRSEPRWSAPRSEPRSSEPIRINPPMVRERSSPRFEGGGSSRMPDSGGGGRFGGGEMRGGGGMPSGGRMGGGEMRGGGAPSGGMSRSSEGGGRSGGGRGRDR